jgi:hypothetical protein
MRADQFAKFFLIVAAAVILLYIVYDYNNRSTKRSGEGFYQNEMPQGGIQTMMNELAVDEEKHEGFAASAAPVVAPAAVGAERPKDCFPRDRLTAEDLLPKDAANNKWSQVNPAGQGDVKDQNFLNAGYHIGVNTIGSSLRNPNLQLRSEPANPQLNVSPWNQTTIDPDLGRRPLELGGCE